MSGPRKTGDLPGQKGDIAASIKQYVEQGLIDLDVMLPAIVEKYDRNKNIVTVRPLIAIVNANRFTEKRHGLANIPAYASGAGDYVINFPIKVGNIGWIFASDRDLTEYKEKLRDVAPRTSRSHSFSDGWFVPDIVRGFTISDEDEDAMVIQTLDGSTKIAIHPDWIKIKAPSKVVNETDLTHSTGKSLVDGDSEVVGDSEVGGDVTVAGGMTVTGAGAFGSLTSGGKRVLVEGDSGGAGDGYTKAEADARFYPKTDGETLAGTVAAQAIVIASHEQEISTLKTKVSNLESATKKKSFLFANGIKSMHLAVNEAKTLLPGAIMQSDGIIMASGVATIPNGGRYKVSASFAVLSHTSIARNVNCMLHINGVSAGAFAVNFLPPTSTLMAVSTDGSILVDAKKNDLMKVVVKAENGTDAEIFSSGYIQIEEI